MNEATALRKAILGREISHAFFAEYLADLRLRIGDAMEGNPPFLEMVIGPSRVGKSMLIHSLAREYPEVVKDGVRHVPVLVVPVPTPATPKQLPRSVLKALGAPLPAAAVGTAATFERMARQLKLAGVLVILFEEASHIVDVGTKLPPRAAGDWFKQLMDMLNISIVLFGVPRLERLLQSNEQLRYRSGAVMRFNPYAWAVPAQQLQFAVCIKAYVKIFAEFGSHFALEFESLVRNTYLLSGGLIGVVAKFMSRLAYDIKSREERAVSFEDCASSASRIETVCGSDYRAFQDANVPDIKLHTVHTLVLDDAGVRYRKVH